MLRTRCTPVYACSGSFSKFKQQVLVKTSKYVGLGLVVAAAAKGLDGVAAFGAGGLIGTSYQWLLQREVDALAKPTSPHTLYKFINTSGFRILVITLCVAFATELQGHSLEQWQLMAGLTGFLMNKIALVQAYLENMTSDSDESL
jgi:hypothetical protein